MQPRLLAAAAGLQRRLSCGPACRQQAPAAAAGGGSGPARWQQRQQGRRGAAAAVRPTAAAPACAVLAHALAAMLLRHATAGRRTCCGLTTATAAWRQGTIGSNNNSRTQGTRPTKLCQAEAHRAGQKKPLFGGNAANTRRHMHLTCRICFRAHRHCTAAAVAAATCPACWCRAACPQSSLPQPACSRAHTPPAAPSSCIRRCQAGSQA